MRSCTTHQQVCWCPLPSAAGDASQLPRAAVERGPGAGSAAAGHTSQPLGVQHRPAGLRGRGRHAVCAQPRGWDAAGAGRPHRGRHTFRERGLAHRPGGTSQVRIPWDTLKWGEQEVTRARFTLELQYNLTRFICWSVQRPSFVYTSTCI